MPLTPQDFVAKWKRVTARERQAYQEHFIDLCHLLDHQTPNEYDPTGTHFAFELGASKTSGGQGWADVAKLGYFGWEYKGKDHDLDKAYDQLLRYRDSLQNPPVLVVSDINQIIIRTNYTNLPTRTIRLSLDDLLLPDSLKILRAVFFNPDELKPRETVAAVTETAASQFARLAGILRKYGDEPQQVAHFLIRLLFCLFAEDIGLLPERLFPRLLDQTRRNAKDFAGILSQLFHAMQEGGYFGADRIRHFNGGLFDDDLVLELDSDAMDTIANIDALDWGAIEPSIFGTLFERGLDPSKRSQLGAHYTSKDDILLIVEPVLMAPLRREWAALQAELRHLKAEAEGESEKKRALVAQKVGEKLRSFADKIAEVKVLDPACGSGNFLYVALQRLLDLQNEVISFSDELGAGRFFITVSPTQLYGIEINEYAHELAQVTIWIGYIQWLVNNGYGLPADPILKRIDNIQHRDAILDFDAEGNPVEPEWPSADVIIGNPPFLGGSKLRRELGDDYVEKLWKLYDSRVPRTSDLVTYWFERSWKHISEAKAKRAGLLATQAIRSPINRGVLETICNKGSIFLAWADRPWILDGASVRVSMIGFDNGNEEIILLDGKPVQQINVHLTTESDIAQAKQLSENAGLSFQGSMIGGNFQIPEAIAQEWLRISNPNGRSNSEVLHPYVTGSDVLRRDSNEWVIDFGDSMSLEAASGYETPFEYIKKYVYPERINNPRASRRERWWLHADPQPAMRHAITNLERYIATVRVAKYRIFVWFYNDTICSNKLIVISRSDDYFLGVLQSHLHEVWSLINSSRHGDGSEGGRPTYTPSTCFNTFPFPWPPGHEPKDHPLVQAIAQAAKELVEMRDRWLNAEGLTDAERKKRTLTNLYNLRPTWLDLAHKKLDHAVFDAYGWPHDLTDEQILEKLLALNLERAGAST